MDSFSARLKELRTQTGANQSKFAEIGGVQKNAQIMYEKGERSPDADYLQRLAAHNLDVQYLLTGVPKNPSFRTVTPAQLLSEIAAHLGLYNNFHELEEIQNQFQKERDAFHNSKGKVDDTTKSFDDIRAWLNKSPSVVFNWADLEAVIGGLEHALAKKDETMAIQHKARAIAHLFRRAKELPDQQRLPAEAFESEVDLYGRPKRDN